MNFETMQDSEIRQELLSRGVNIGPVTPSTRNLYIKKLQKLIVTKDNAAGDAEHINTANHKLEQASDNLQDRVSTLYPALDVAPMFGRRSPVPLLNFDEEEPISESSGDEAEESARFLTPEEIEAENLLHTSRLVKRPTTNNGFGYIIKAILLVAILVFLFFVAERTFEKGTHESEDL